MQVQSMAEDAQVRHRVRFIGFIKDRSLLVTLPMRNGERMWMEQGQPFIVRGFNGRCAYAFTTQVIRARAHPFPYVHFSWPRMVECQIVRSSPRVAVSLPASLSRGDGAPMPATMLDVSVCGAMLDSCVETREAGDHVKLGFTVDFEGDAIGLSVSAVVRNVHPKENEAGVRIGLEFENVSRNDSLLLHYFINTVTGGE